MSKLKPILYPFFPMAIAVIFLGMSVWGLVKNDQSLTDTHFVQGHYIEGSNHTGTLVTGYIIGDVEREGDTISYHDFNGDLRSRTHKQLTLVKIPKVIALDDYTFNKTKSFHQAILSDYDVIIPNKFIKHWIFWPMIVTSCLLIFLAGALNLEDWWRSAIFKSDNDHLKMKLRKHENTISEQASKINGLNVLTKTLKENITYPEEYTNSVIQLSLIHI